MRDDFVWARDHYAQDRALPFGIKSLKDRRRVVFVIGLCSWAQPGYGNITFPLHRAPTPGREWIDTDSTSHNHNTFFQRNMENIRRQPNREYDAIGSWRSNLDSSMFFIGTLFTRAGRDHTDRNSFGHGFVHASSPLVYSFEGVPANVTQIVTNAFEEWEDEINNNDSVNRNPGMQVGFEWEPRVLGLA